MTFGEKFRAIRVHRVMEDATRQQVRDRIRAFQLRNDGSPKEIRPEPVRHKRHDSDTAPPAVRNVHIWCALLAASYTVMALMGIIAGLVAGHLFWR